MCIEAKSTRSWKYSPADTYTHFPPGSTFQPNRNAVATGLSFISTLCTRSERNLPILMENKKDHQITLPKGRIGLSSLDVVDRDEPKYQIRSPYALTNAIIATDERYNDCFPCIPQLRPRALTNSYRSSMGLKMRSFTNPIQLDIAYPRALEWVKVLRTSYPTESLVLNQHAGKQSFSWDKSTPFGIQQESALSTIW